MPRKTRVAGLAALCAGVLMTAACGGGGSESGESGDKTITWWHNSNNEPGRGYYEQVAKDFEADHPGVDVKISAMAHEDMVDKLEAAFQSGDVPDVYMERGGGELADHVEAGLVRDLTEDASEEISKVGGSVATSSSTTSPACTKHGSEKSRSVAAEAMASSEQLRIAA